MGRHPSGSEARSASDTDTDATRNRNRCRYFAATAAGAAWPPIRNRLLHFQAADGGIQLSRHAAVDALQPHEAAAALARGAQRLQITFVVELDELTGGGAPLLAGASRV